MSLFWNVSGGGMMAEVPVDSRRVFGLGCVV